jgi:hypothetical protein
MQERNGIPKFDLAEQIMSEHRKNASVRRKRPARTGRPAKRAPKVEPVDLALGLHAVPPGQERVIADIVTRDIERLCRGRA